MKASLPAVATAAEDSQGRSAFELADVVRHFGPSFVQTYPSSGAQRRVLRAIGRCRTAALGGHVEGCDQCGHQRIAYNSCRNRHCPKCLGKARAKWLTAEQALLLAVDYFHVVFTLPHELNALIRANQRRLYELLFHAAAATLQEFARRHLGAELGITMVLHTWGQTLTEHAHVHCVVSGGGLSADRKRWVRVRRSSFLFPVRAMSKVFAGKFMAGLTQCYDTSQLRLVGQSACLAHPGCWQDLCTSLRQLRWVVYAKRPFGGPERVLKYLSRYTHRVAIANRRIRFVGDGVVRFEYKDYAAASDIKEMTLSGEEFLRRFLLHVLPSGFQRIRHYGLLANAQRAEKLDRCRQILATSNPSPPQAESTPPVAEVASPSADPAPAARCPRCGGRMQILEVIPALRRDTS